MHRISLRATGKALILPAIAALTLSGAHAAEVAKTAPPITWTDVQGHRYGPADLSSHKASVFLFWSSQCPIANRYVPRMVELARDYQAKGVQFFLVDSN